LRINSDSVINFLIMPKDTPDSNVLSRSENHHPLSRESKSS
jgi:hypothetical protein